MDIRSVGSLRKALYVWEMSKGKKRVSEATKQRQRQAVLEAAARMLVDNDYSEHTESRSEGT